MLPAVESGLRARFGLVPQRAAVSFVGVDPIEVLRFETEPGRLSYVSLGMARSAMTGADSAVLRADGPRAELLLHVRDPQARFGDAWRALAVLAAAPVVEAVVYTDGLAVDLGVPLAAASRCTGGVVVADEVADLETSAGPVSLLRLLPATAAELAWGRVHGSDALRSRWTQRQVDLLDLGRAAVALG